MARMGVELNAIIRKRCGKAAGTPERSHNGLLTSEDALRYLLVAAGGALGSVARYALDGLILRLASPYFPSGTFAVNAVGCLVFGLIIGFAEVRSLLTPTGRLFLLIGLLGGFTTFSTFTFETFQLVRGGEYVRGAINAAGQVVVGYLAIWAGYIAGRSIL